MVNNNNLQFYSKNCIEKPKPKVNNALLSNKILFGLNALIYKINVHIH